MATQFAHRGEPISVGRILSRSFAVMAANPVVVLGIAFVFGAIPSVILEFFTERLSLGLDEETNGFRDGAFLQVGSFVLSFVLTMIAQGALVRATTAHAEGRRATVTESVMAGLRVALPLVLLAFVIGLGVSLGTIFLIVPGAILYVMWSVASPALVEERVGVGGALSRSSFLTKGARWKVFGLQLVVLLALLIWSALLSIVIIASSGGVEAATNGPQALSLSAMIGTTIMSTFITAFWSTIQTSLYVDLHEWKDGPQATHLEDVFA